MSKNQNLHEIAKEVQTIPANIPHSTEISKNRASLLSQWRILCLLALVFNSKKFTDGLFASNFDLETPFKLTSSGGTERPSSSPTLIFRQRNKS